MVMSDVLPTPEGPHTTIGLGILARSASGFFGATTSVATSAETRLTSGVESLGRGVAVQRNLGVEETFGVPLRLDAGRVRHHRVEGRLGLGQPRAESALVFLNRRRADEDGERGFPSGTFIRPGIAVASFDAQNAANASCASTEGRFTRRASRPPPRTRDFRA